MRRYSWRRIRILSAVRRRRRRILLADAPCACATPQPRQPAGARANHAASMQARRCSSNSVLPRRRARVARSSSLRSANRDGDACEPVVVLLVRAIEMACRRNRPSPTRWLIALAVKGRRASSSPPPVIPDAERHAHPDCRPIAVGRATLLRARDPRARLHVAREVQSATAACSWEDRLVPSSRCARVEAERSRAACPRRPRPRSLREDAMARNSLTSQARARALHRRPRLGRIEMTAQPNPPTTH